MRASGEGQDTQLTECCPHPKAIVFFKYFTWMCNFRQRRGLRIEWALLAEQPLILWTLRYPAGLCDEMFSLQLRKELHGERNQACTNTAISVGKTSPCLLVDSKAHRERKAQWHCLLQAMTCELGCQFGITPYSRASAFLLVIWETIALGMPQTDGILLWHPFDQTQLLLQRAENWMAAGHSWLRARNATGAGGWVGADAVTIPIWSQPWVSREEGREKWK